VSDKFDALATLPPPPKERAFGSNWIESWVGPSTDLGLWPREKNPFIAPAGNRTTAVEYVS